MKWHSTIRKEKGDRRRRESGEGRGRRKGEREGKTEEGREQGRWSDCLPGSHHDLQVEHGSLADVVSHLNGAKSKAPELIHFCLTLYLMEVNDNVLISYLPLQSLFSVIAFNRLPRQAPGWFLTPEVMKPNLQLYFQLLLFPGYTDFSVLFCWNGYARVTCRQAGREKELCAH